MNADLNMNKYSAYPLQRNSQRHDPNLWDHHYIPTNVKSPFVNVRNQAIAYPKSSEQRKNITEYFTGVTAPNNTPYSAYDPMNSTSLSALQNVDTYNNSLYSTSTTPSTVYPMNSQMQSDFNDSQVSVYNNNNPQISGYYNDNQMPSTGQRVSVDFAGYTFPPSRQTVDYNTANASACKQACLDSQCNRWNYDNNRTNATCRLNMSTPKTAYSQNGVTGGVVYNISNRM